MRPLLFITFLFFATFSFGQMNLQDVENKKIIQRIEFIKSKTDSFLLTPFKKNIKTKFQFQFLNCGYFRGEFRSIYQFLNSDKPEPEDLYNLTHSYSFLDKDINFKTDIDIWFFQDKGIKMEFQTIVDSLKYEAINKIYNKGVINKIKAKVAELKLKKPYTVIQVDQKARTFDVILKDKLRPHNYFIR